MSACATREKAKLWSKGEREGGCEVERSSFSILDIDTVKSLCIVNSNNSTSHIALHIGKAQKHPFSKNGMFSYPISVLPPTLALKWLIAKLYHHSQSYESSYDAPPPASATGPSECESSRQPQHDDRLPYLKSIPNLISCSC